MKKQEITDYAVVVDKKSGITDLVTINKTLPVAERKVDTIMEDGKYKSKNQVKFLEKGDQARVRILTEDPKMTSLYAKKRK